MGLSIFYTFSPCFDIQYSNPSNQTAIEAVNKFATALAARFSPIVGCTRSWDSSDPTDFQACSFHIRLLDALP